ncbi:Na/Pi cotransporter family protein [Hoeflea prorocentri]|uniref:Na/Pi symporter n=1 Tax=Hoeflea prorocentri TaxID=1922333 RepID=A0A9X3UEP0_9HYPH|nr:Na/Pi symporter [Hoeflea prorocentri]MCY6379465.1 Na/Pi symporter [Hoeflea prorocentri]MDA5397265.1 Na/Pi symporter [Hoeflea prorocentri]
MDVLILKALGGVGLFLIGMFILTDGLRQLAGNALRNLLRRSTRSPLSGAVAGAFTTAILQSSSATTVATVGFVGAGLITFPQALGVIFGANIGTTMTGWLVAILGFKLNLGLIVTPLVFFGAMLKIFGSGRWQHIGWSLAGFSLLFIGIDAMQQGMSFLREVVSPSDFPDNTVFGRIQLVFIGMAITLVTQSSSAGVAVALAALSTGAISFPQAAALVIGMDVGTTFTAVLATLGGSTSTRRTGYAHVIYNVLAGTLALILLTPLTGLIERLTSTNGSFDPQIALVAFHTTFNVMGVIVMLSIIRYFARLVIRLVPERGPVLTAQLDDHLLSDSGAAVDAMVGTIKTISNSLFEVVADQMAGRGAGSTVSRLGDIDKALETFRRYAEQVRIDPSRTADRDRYTATLHAMDHLIRMLRRCRQLQRIEQIARDPGLAGLGSQMRAQLLQIVEGPIDKSGEKETDRLRKHLRARRNAFRSEVLDMAPGTDVDEILVRIDSVRWLHRVAYHIWRIVHYRLISQEIAPKLVDEDKNEMGLEIREMQDD